MIEFTGEYRLPAAKLDDPSWAGPSLATVFHSNAGRIVF